MYPNFIYISALLLVCVKSSEINIFPSLPTTVLHSENDLCQQHSQQFLENIDNFTVWAYEMKDASAQSAANIFRGSGYNLGNVDECLTVNGPFPTQYCLAIIVANVPKPKTRLDPFSLYYEPNENVINKLYDYKDETKLPRNVLRMGWCIPASCSPAEAGKSLNKYLQNYEHPLKKENVSYSAIIPEVFCQSSNNESKLDTTDISFCLLCVVLLLLVIAATAIDYNEDNFCPKKKPKVLKLLMAFSARKNFRGLLKVEKVEQPMKILFGIRTISMLAVIVAHRGGISVNTPMINVDSIAEFFRSPWTSVFYHIDLFVDTFFFISGLLVTYIVLGTIEKKKFNPGLLILYRFSRLTPAYAFVVFFHATLLYHTGDGVLWGPFIGSERQDCRDNWWTNIIYVSNLVNSEHMCMLQSWYLPCDFHFFIIALVLVYLLSKDKNLGFAGIILSCLVTMAVTFYLLFVNERPPFLRFFPDYNIAPKFFTDFQLTYIKTYTRGLPYFVGMIAGYIYYTLKGTDYKISKIQKNTILTMSFILMITLFLTAFIYNDPYHKYNALESASVGAFNRLLWGLATLGFVYSISFGDHGIIFRFLASEKFVPFSKLTYGAYLCHLGFQLRQIASLVSPKKFSIIDLTFLWIVDVVMAFTLALVLYLLVEEPFKKILFGLLIRKKKTDVTKNLPETIDNKLENTKV